MTRLRIPLVAAAVLAASPALALDKRFDPSLNGPWQTFDLGRSDATAAPSWDPKGVGVAADGTAYVFAKRPVDGPPTGGDVFRVDATELAPVGGTIGEDLGALLLDADAPMVGTKGTPTNRAGRVLRLVQDAWTAVEGASLPSEVTSMVVHEGVLHVATQTDGVYRIDGGVPSRVGVRTEVLEAGHVWTDASDFDGDVETLARLADGRVVVVGKDLQVRVVANGVSTVLGNLSSATYDELGTILSYVREPKGLALGPAGEIYVGTKGRAGSAEGANVGVVWTWNGAEWVSISAGVAMAPEVKSLVFAGGALYAGTPDTGVWRWNGSSWAQMNEGLPVESGKVRGQELVRAADGLLYVMSKNVLYARALDAASWSEVGFFALGEEFKSVAVDGGGVRYVGTKVGTGAGAVYRQDGASWVQLGGDFALEARRLAFDSAGVLHVALGGVGGAFRWDGAAWTSILGALTGNAAQVKELVALPDAELLAATKQGLWHGVFRDEAVTVLHSALQAREVKAIFSVGGQLLAVAKKGGVFRLVADETGDDGHAWADGDAGLADVELEGATLLDGEVWLLGKQLLYRGVLDAQGVLRVEPVGTNPGKAALDGNGRLVFTGETAFTAVARDSAGRLYAGTKDGLFVAQTPGAAWTLFNGPAEVKGLAIVGDRLVVAVKGEISDPSAPTATVKTAQVWVRDLSVLAPASSPSGGCASGGATGAGALVLVALALLLSLAARTRARMAGR